MAKEEEKVGESDGNVGEKQRKKRSRETGAEQEEVHKPDQTPTRQRF